MIPIPHQITSPGGSSASSLLAWRLEREVFFPTWTQGIGPHLAGGRWNKKGVHVIYTSLDPATTILELAVHAGFDFLDTVPHRLISIEILAPEEIHIAKPESVPNPMWLSPGNLTPGQQEFGSKLITEHPFVLIPSVVSSHSWNLLINPNTAFGKFKLDGDERFALDPRFNPIPS